MVQRVESSVQYESRLEVLQEQEEEMKEEDNGEKKSNIMIHNDT
jgi:hypothetical protein